MFDYEREKQARSAASVADSLLYQEKSAMRKLVSSFCNLMILFVCVHFFIDIIYSHLIKSQKLLSCCYFSFGHLSFYVYIQTSMTCSLGPSSIYKICLFG